MVLTAHLKREERKRAVMLVGIFTFLFHAVFPYYQVASAEAVEGVDGYTTTICTAYGYKTVFVAFGETPSSDASSYYECPTCLVQANASGWMDTYAPLFEVLLPQAEGLEDLALSQTPERRIYASFLIRGPPA